MKIQKKIKKIEGGGGSGGQVGGRVIGGESGTGWGVRVDVNEELNFLG